MSNLTSHFWDENGFMPHGMCYLWQPGILTPHVASDALIAAAYFFIPFTLTYFIRRRKDREFNLMTPCAIPEPTGPRKTAMGLQPVFRTHRVPLMLCRTGAPALRCCHIAMHRDPEHRRAKCPPSSTRCTSPFSQTPVRPPH